MRVKTGFTRKARHQKVLARTRGFRMTKNRLYKVAKEADLHAGQYAFVGRKDKKHDFRTLWIQRINAGLKPYELSYSKFINLAKIAQVTLNRKMLADLALNNPEVFKKVVETIRP